MYFNSSAIKNILGHAACDKSEEESGVTEKLVRNEKIGVGRTQQSAQRLDL